MLEETKLIVQRSEYCGLPQLCASCLSTESLEYKIVRSPGSPWSDTFEVSVPLCGRCARRSRWLQPVGGLAVFLAFAGVANNHFHLPRFQADLLLLLAALCGYAVERLKGPVRVQSKSDGRLIFWFRNPEFARLFEARDHSSYETATVAGVL